MCLRPHSNLNSHIDGANQHFFLIPTIPLALKFIIYLNISVAALFHRWRSIRPVGFLGFGKQICQKILTSCEAPPRILQNSCHGRPTIRTAPSSVQILN